MKVAMLTTTSDHCGIAAYSRSLIEALQESMDVTVEPIQVGRQPLEHYRAQAVRLNAADVVHIQHEYSFWGGVLPHKSTFSTLLRLIDKPVVITAHTIVSLAGILRVKEEHRPLHRIAKELLLRWRRYRDAMELVPFVTPEACIVHTEAMRCTLMQRGANPQHVHMIPPGVPSPRATPTAGNMFRARFGLANRRIISLFGYIAPNKGYELTLQILPRLPPEIVFAIAGGARTPEMEPYAKALRARIVAAGLKNRVIITGCLSEEEIAEVMAASEIVVVPQTWATGSYSIMVPLAYGKPIVASDLDCFREIQARLPCLYLFRVGNAEHYLDCLKTVLDTPALRAKLEEQAAHYAVQHTWRDVAHKTVGVYKAALAEGRKSVSYK